MTDIAKSDQSKVRKRCKNFSPKEEQLLLELVKKYWNIIGNKRSDSINVDQKRKVWQNLTSEFNQIIGEIYRDMKTLQNKYDNLKKRCKTKFASEKKYTCGTGGGPPTTNFNNKVEESVLELLGTQITGFTSKYDDDCNMVESPSSNETVNNEHNIIIYSPEIVDSVTIPGSSCNDKTNVVEVPQVEVEDCLPCEVAMSSDWSKFATSDLRKPASKELRTIEKSQPAVRRRYQNRLETKLSKWAVSKAETVVIQKQFAKEQHEEKLKLMREEHKIKIALMREEHALKMEILNIQKKLLNE